MFAVVEEPPPQVPLLPKSKGLLKSKEKEAQRLAAAAADAAAAAALQTVVRIRELEGTGMRVTCQQVRLGRKGPARKKGACKDPGLAFWVRMLGEHSACSPSRWCAAR